MSLAATPLAPSAIFPQTAARLFPVIAGATVKEEMPCGVEASLGADSTYLLRFDVGPLPTGTMKLLAKLRTSDTTAHAAKLSVSWNVATTAADVDALTFNAVTANVNTVSNDTAHAWALTEAKITMDGSSTMVADRAVYVKIVFNTASWTINAVSGWAFFLIWE